MEHRQAQAEAPAPPSPAAPDLTAALAVLQARPGFLVRRLHQIHTALFMAETAGSGITPVQYSLLTLLAEAPGLEQRRAAAALGLDRFSMADVSRRLQASGLLRAVPGQDRRAKALMLTAEGLGVLETLAPAVARAHARLTECLPAQEGEALLHGLRAAVATLEVEAPQEGEAAAKPADSTENPAGG